MKTIGGMTKMDCLMMLEDYKPPIEVFIAGYNTEWFMNDLEKIFNYESEYYAEHQLNLWFTFLEGCRTNRYGM